MLGIGRNRLVRVIIWLNDGPVAVSGETEANGK